MENNELLMYLLKVTTIHGVFFLLYYLFLRGKTTYVLNRTYLLATLIASFIIPMLEIPVAEKSIPTILTDAEVLTWQSMETHESTVSMEPATNSASSTDYRSLLIWVYACLALVLIVRSISHLFILQKLKKQSVYVEKKWFKLFKTAQVHPFSFLSNVFIPKRVFGTDSFDHILEHECEHVRQHHSYDRLLVDFMVALFWFNPFMYLYRRALIEIHEYQADAAVLRKFPDPIGYQEVLYSQLKSTPYSGLVSHFNFSTIKKRIVMINKQKNKRSIWAYLLAVPVTLFVILAFANKTKEETSPGLPSEPAPQQDINVAEVGKVDNETVSENVKTKPVVTTRILQDNFTPSILPLKDASKMKVTSGFGMRTDPIDQKRKMHEGIDLGTPVGTVVISTADGVVHQAGYHDKYGYFVLIEHSDKYMTRYSQLSKLMVERGDKVTRKQEIALSGKSGRATGPHLHYEVIEVGVGHKDPRDYIKNHKLPTAILILDPSPTTEEEKLARLALERQLAEEQAIARAKEGRYQELAAMEQRAKELELEREQAALQNLEREKELREAEMAAYEEQLRRERESFLDIKNITKNPLYILDGKIIDEKETRLLTPEQIEHVEVMKGEGAIKKYGEDAKGGVIIIDTKKAKKEKPKVKSKGKSKSGENEDPRLSKVYDFLRSYEKEKFNKDDWTLILKDDRVKLRKSGSLQSITLYKNYFESAQTQGNRGPF